MTPYRVLVVDDSAFMRTIIGDLILQDKQFTIVATAANGIEAVAAAARYRPDVMTIDLEMPVMNGLEALQLIMKATPLPVIMLSGISEDNTRDTIKALQYGAFDFIRKPSGAASGDIHQVGELLREKLRAAVESVRKPPALQERGAPQAAADASAATAGERAEAKPRRIPPAPPTRPPDQAQRRPAEGEPPPPLAAPQEGRRAAVPAAAPPNKKLPAAESPAAPAAKPGKPAARPPDLRGPAAAPPPPIERKLPASGAFRHIVAIGTSTGGPRALHEVICSLPPGFPAPVLVVQHMPPRFTKSLAQRLDSFSALEVVEAEQGMRVAAGFVYIAPGGYHMELARDSLGYWIKLGNQPQRNGHRPSVDVMFESLAPLHELTRHAVIMTGMGSDGAKGMKLLAESGAASTIAESEETCVVYGMPRSAVEGGAVQSVLPLQHIAPQLVNAVLK